MSTTAVECENIVRECGLLATIKNMLDERRDHIFICYHNGIRTTPHDHLFAIREWCEDTFNHPESGVNFCTDIMNDFQWSSDIITTDDTFDSYVTQFLLGMNV